MASDAPADRVFIVGCARTGSTLVQHILNRSPDVSLAPETHYFKRSRRLRLSRRLGPAAAPREIRSVLARLYTTDSDSLRGGWAWMRRNVPFEEFYQRFVESDRSERALLDLLMAIYAERTKGAIPPIIGEKTPEHFLHLDKLLHWYPAARIIHTFRDPRAIYVSELRRRRQGRWGLKYRLRALPEGLVDPVLPASQILHTTIRWSQAVSVDRRFGPRLGPRYLRVRYEDLVTEPEVSVRRICAFAGIDYTDALLDVSVTGSSYSSSRHAGHGIDPSAVDRWREHIGSFPMRWFSLALRSRLRAYGYRV